jgi:hypothetical protein
MRIYADPELPDVVVKWADFTCPDDVGDVRVELRSYDTDELRFEATGRCTDRSVTVADVDRERYRVRGYLLDRASEVYDASSGEADLRNGLSERVDMYWSGYANVVVGWQFANGDTCSSLGAEVVMVEQTRAEAPDYKLITVELCTDAITWFTVVPGQLQLRVRGLGTAGTVAISEPTPVLDVAQMMRTDTGSLVLAPCGTTCPPLPGY